MSSGFEPLGLIEPLAKVVAELGYKTPTPVQEQAIPLVLAGRDLMAGAQTGTGKTAAFALPILQRLAPLASSSASPARHPVRALVLAPTRELAVQVADSFRDYGRHVPLRSTVVYGGVDMNAQINELRRGVEILVATPGRLLDHVQNKTVMFNQVSVLVLDEAPPDDWMAAVARETNLSDTGFVIREELPDADFRLRWFTPTVEVDLCGHATLASAHCLFEDGVTGPIRFATRSGVLTVDRRADGSLAMDFPAWMTADCEAARGAVEAALGAPVVWTGRTINGFFLLALMADEASVRDLAPDLDAVSELDASVGLIPTAAAGPGRDYDFVSRVFAPQAGIPEDPVTGSAHTVLAPYWAERLGRTSLTGFQVSSRSGLVGVELHGDRVTVIGHAVTVSDGVLTSAADPG